MDKPTLIIGIGTSGLRVLEQVQYFYRENTGTNRPKNVAYLYLETDENSHPQTIGDNDIKQVYISLKNRETLINGLKEEKQLDTFWLPKIESVLDTGFGAGGWPSFGRLAMWGGSNFDLISRSIKTSWSEIASHNILESKGSEPAIFIVGSLTGGTGTGIFIDMAYLVKHLIDEVREVFGLFLIPGQDSYRGKETIYCNSYAALKSLDYYNDRNTEVKYEQMWPSNQRVKFKEPPYELTQIISQDYDGGIPSINSLNGLYKMAGMYLFLNIFGLRNKRLTRLGDAKQNGHIDKWGTFGLSAIQFPKAQLEEYLALHLSTELLSRWIDAQKYYNKGEKKHINTEKTQIANNTSLKFEQIMKEAFDALNSVNVSTGKIITQDIKEQAITITKKEHQESSNPVFVQKLFSSNFSNNYYDAIKNNISIARDIVISRIHGLIEDSLEKYENLHLTKLQLDSINRAVDQIINYWKSNNVSGRMENWEILLEKLATDIFKNTYKHLFEQNVIITERMMSILEQLKMHLFANSLVDIKNSIINSKGENALRSFQDNVELPQIKKLDDIITVIQKTIGEDKGKVEKETYLSLLDRKNEIESDIRDNTLPILRIFSTDSFEGDFEKALNNYGKGVPSKFTIIRDEKLYSFLNTKTNALNKKIYDTCLEKFQNSIAEAKCIEDQDVSDYIVRKSGEARKIAERAMHPLVKVNPDKKTVFEDSMYIPRLVIAQNEAAIAKIIDAFQQENFNQYRNDEDGIFVKNELRNIVFFYDEKGYMNNRKTFNPMVHLRYIYELKDLYQRYAEDKGYTEKEWHQIRMPYVKYEDIKKQSDEKN